MNRHKCLWKRNIRLSGSHPDRALGGNSPVLKSVLSPAEVEQLMEHSHPGGKFRRRKASFALRNSDYCGRSSVINGTGCLCCVFPSDAKGDAAEAVNLLFVLCACVCKAGYESRPLSGTGCGFLLHILDRHKWTEVSLSFRL